MSATQIVGAAGEAAAEEWLELNDFVVIARNWRSGRYELDIVALRGETIHFVEVKTRVDSSWESPEEAMNAAKQRNFRRAAQAWMAENHTDLEPQMDLIAVDRTPDGTLDVRYIAHAVISRW